jgi:Tat protein secretion system quality control protein TatD with DNase activity
METIKAVPEDRVLVESDMHTAGEDMDDALERAVKVIAGIRGLEIDHCVKKLAGNWKAFVFGDN